MRLCGACGHRLDLHDPDCRFHGRYKCDCDCPSIPITETELEIIKGIAAGKGLKEIAAESGRAVSTLKAHRFNISRKTGCGTNLTLVLSAISSGLVKMEELPQRRYPIFVKPKT